MCPTPLPYLGFVGHISLPFAFKVIQILLMFILWALFIIFESFLKLYLFCRLFAMKSKVIGVASGTIPGGLEMTNTANPFMGLCTAIYGPMDPKRHWSFQTTPLRTTMEELYPLSLPERSSLIISKVNHD